MNKMKYCSGCRKTKALDEFAKNKSKKGGIDSYCKICRREICKKWASKNLKTKMKSILEWRIKNPDKVFEYNLTGRARKLGVEGKVTAQEWRDLCNKYDNSCLRCGRTDVKLSPDHVIPLSKGGTNTINNLQPLCLQCNNIKHKNSTDYRR